MKQRKRKNMQVKMKKRNHLVAIVMKKSVQKHRNKKREAKHNRTE